MADPQHVCSGHQLRNPAAAAALLGSLPKAECLLASTGYGANWYAEAPKVRDAIPGILSRKSLCGPVKFADRHHGARNRIEILFGRLKDWRRVARRCDRCPEVFLSSAVFTAIVTFWP